MQDDWLSSPASSASSSAETIALAVDRLTQAMARLQEQMEAQYRATKALTDKIDKITQQPDAKPQPAVAKPQGEPSGLPPKPIYHSPRRSEVRFQLERSSQQAPSTPAAPSAANTSLHEKKLPYKSPVSMFQGQRASSPILPAADSSVDLSLLTPLSTPDRKFPDSLPLEDIELTRSETSDPEEEITCDDEHAKNEHGKPSVSQLGDAKLAFVAALNESPSQELQPLSLLELSDDATIHPLPTRHQRIPPYELCAPSASHLHLLSHPLVFSEACRGWSAAAAASPAASLGLRDSSFWRRRLDRHSFGALTTFL